MKVYLLVNLKSYEYASFAHVGVWKDVRENCNICNANTQILVEPLQIKWEPGSDEIGDFSWCAYNIIVLDRVKDYLLDNKYDCNFGRVEVLKYTLPIRKRKVVPYPYSGSKLNWLLPKVKVNLDIKKSGLEVKIDCSACGYFGYKFKMEGIVIPKKEWHGERIFRIYQFGTSSATYVTEEALHELLSQGFTNLAYIEVGYIEE